MLTKIVAMLRSPWLKLDKVCFVKRLSIRVFVFYFVLLLLCTYIYINMTYPPSKFYDVIINTNIFMGLRETLFN